MENACKKYVITKPAADGDLCITLRFWYTFQYKTR